MVMGNVLGIILHHLVDWVSKISYDEVMVESAKIKNSKHHLIKINGLIKINRLHHNIKFYQNNKMVWN